MYRKRKHEHLRGLYTCCIVSVLQVRNIENFTVSSTIIYYESTAQNKWQIFVILTNFVKKKYIFNLC